jgi:hypothetical protein
MTPLAWCVSGYESGHGANVNNGAGDLGWVQFTVGTYDYVLNQMQAHHVANTSGWDRDPLTAPVVQQIAAFDYYEPIDPGAWPNTVPRCIAEGY